MAKLAALILAGGQATRMGGGDKPLLDLGGRTLIEHGGQRLAGQAGSVAVSANGDAARFAQLGLPVLADQVTGRGPLGGVLRGLAWAESVGADAMLSVPGDTPFIPRDLAARLGTAPAWVQNVAATHPLVAVWPVSCRETLAQWLASQKSGRVRAFGELIGMRSVWFEDAPDPFRNINTPAELTAAARQAVLF